MPIKYDKLFALLKEKGYTTYRIRKEGLLGQGTLCLAGLLPATERCSVRAPVAGQGTSGYGGRKYGPAAFVLDFAGFFVHHDCRPYCAHRDVSAFV